MKELINSFTATSCESRLSDPEVEVKVKIPIRLLTIITKNIVGSNYARPEDYIRNLVIEAVDDDSAYSREEEETVRKRLASLGYE